MEIKLSVGWFLNKLLVHCINFPSKGSTSAVFIPSSFKAWLSDTKICVLRYWWPPVQSVKWECKYEYCLLWIRTEPTTRHRTPWYFGANGPGVDRISSSLQEAFIRDYSRYCGWVPWFRILWRMGWRSNSSDAVRK